MVKACVALIAGGALVVVPVGMGGIPLVKLLLFALAALCGIVLCSSRMAHLGVEHSVSRQGFLFAFFAVVFLSPLWSTAPFLSIVGVEPRFEGVMAYGIFLGLALVAGGMVRGGREQSLLHAVLWSNASAVLYGLLQMVRMDPLGGWWDADVFLGRVFSSIGQPNALAQFLLLTGPLAIFAAWRRNSLSPPLGHEFEAEWRERVRVRGYSWSIMLLLTGNILVLLATGSRAGIVGLGVSFLVYIWCFNNPLSRGERVGRGVDRNFCGSGSAYTPLPNPPPKGEGSNRYSVGIYHLFFGIWIILSIAILCGAIFLHRFAIPGEWNRSIHGRIAIWRDAVSMIRERPLGWGLETTGMIFPRFQSAPLTAYESLTTSVDRAHSKPLDLLLTLGIPGFLGYYAFLVLLFIRCLRVWRERRDAVMLAGAVGIVGLSVSLLFGFEGVVVHAFFWLICGMLTTLTLPSPFKGRGYCSMACATKFPPPFKGEGEGEGSVAILLMITIFTALSLSSRLTAHRAERVFQRGDVAAAVQGYDRAVHRAPWDRALLVRFLETALFARERVNDRQDIPSEAILDAVIDQRLRSLTFLTSDLDPLLPSLQAWHAALQGKEKETLVFLEEAKTRAPFSVPRLRIVVKVAELLDNPAMEIALRAELMRMLPPWWDDPIDTRSRILRKENPWLEEFLTPSPRGRGSG